jgi:hypothetical protein
VRAVNPGQPSPGMLSVASVSSFSWSGQMSMRCQLSPNRIVTTPSRSYVHPRSVPYTCSGNAGGNAAAAGSRAGTSAHSRVVSNRTVMGPIEVSVSVQAEAAIANSATRTPPRTAPQFRSVAPMRLLTATARRGAREARRPVGMDTRPSALHIHSFSDLALPRLCLLRDFDEGKGIGEARRGPERSDAPFLWHIDNHDYDVLTECSEFPKYTV